MKTYRSLFTASVSVESVELKSPDSNQALNSTVCDSSESSVWFKSLSQSPSVQDDRFTDNWIEVERKS